MMLLNVLLEDFRNVPQSNTMVFSEDCRNPQYFNLPIFSPLFFFLLVYKVPTPGIIPMRFIVSLPRCEFVVNLHMRVSSRDKCVFFSQKKIKNLFSTKGK